MRNAGAAPNVDVSVMTSLCAAYLMITGVSFLAFGAGELYFERHLKGRPFFTPQQLMWAAFMWPVVGAMILLGLVFGDGDA